MSTGWLHAWARGEAAARRGAWSSDRWAEPGEEEKLINIPWNTAGERSRKHKMAPALILRHLRTIAALYDGDCIALSPCGPLRGARELRAQRCAIGGSAACTMPARPCPTLSPRPGVIFLNQEPSAYRFVCDPL